MLSSIVKSEKDLSVLKIDQRTCTERLKRKMQTCYILNNDVIIQNYVRPKKKKKSRIWSSIAMHFLWLRLSSIPHLILLGNHKL